MTGNQSIGKALYDAHPDYREATLDKRRFKHKDMLPLIEQLRADSATVSCLGQSVEERDVYEIKLGSGKKNIMLWSQMHGDEPTSTMAIFDMLHFLQATDTAFAELRNLILSELTICFIPMLNPDGVERFQRRNAMEIDLNRDAKNMACPESRILKAAYEKNKPLFGFNLHDQSKYYNVPQTKNSASYLMNSIQITLAATMMISNPVPLVTTSRNGEPALSWLKQEAFRVQRRTILGYSRE